jgi:hypothetical protein
MTFKVGDKVMILTEIDKIAPDARFPYSVKLWSYGSGYVDASNMYPGTLASIVREIDDLRAKLAAAEKERDEARKDAAEWELDCTTAEAGEKRMAAERDAARAELATLRALMPEVRRVVQMTADWVVPQHLGGLNASDWFAKHGEWQAFGHSALALLAKLPAEQENRSWYHTTIAEREELRARLAAAIGLLQRAKPEIYLGSHGNTEIVREITAFLDTRAKLPAEDKPATAEPKRVREWRYEENGYWAEYRSGGRDGRVQRRSQDCPEWYDDIQTIADMEEHVRTNPRYRETTPQPAPAPVAGNVPLTLHGPASLAGKTVQFWTCDHSWATVEVKRG